MCGFDWEENTCSLCAIYRPGPRGDERLIAHRNEQRFELGLDLYRDPPDRARLREERARRIEVGEHPGPLVCVCDRCGRNFCPWGNRPEPRCRPCNDQVWLYDEGWTRTRAFRSVDVRSGRALWAPEEDER